MEMCDWSHTCTGFFTRPNMRTTENHARWRDGDERLPHYRFAFNVDASPRECDGKPGPVTPYHQRKWYGEYHSILDPGDIGEFTRYFEKKWNCSLSPHPDKDDRWAKAKAAKDKAAKENADQLEHDIDSLRYRFVDCITLKRDYHHGSIHRHPDKGGSDESFIRLTRAFDQMWKKNQCFL
jgi:hypothetical protein